MIISPSLYNIWYVSRSENIYWEPVLFKALCREQRVISASDRAVLGQNAEHRLTGYLQPLSIL